MQDAVCTHAHKTDCAEVDVEFSSDNRVDVRYIKNVSGKLMSLCQLSRNVINKCSAIPLSNLFVLMEFLWWLVLSGWLHVRVSLIPWDI